MSLLPQKVPFMHYNMCMKTSLHHKIEKSAGGIVFKITPQKVLWLVTQHSHHKGWGFPKGLIGDLTAGERPEDAAVREVKEEGGIEAKICIPEPVSVSYTYRFEQILVDKTVYYYLMRYISGDPKNHDWEVSDAVFLPEARVLETLTFPTDKQAFEKILSRYHNSPESG